MKRSKRIKQQSCTHFNMFPNSLYLLPVYKNTKKKHPFIIGPFLTFLCFSTQGQNKMGQKNQFLLNWPMPGFAPVYWFILKHWNSKVFQDELILWPIMKDLEEKNNKIPPILYYIYVS